MSTQIDIHLPEYLRKNQRILENLHSDYQHIVIAEDPEFGRLLYLDDDLQIAEADEAYNRAMIDPLLEADKLGNVLILGGGDGGVLNTALQEGAEQVTLVDIDAKVLELAERYLPRMCGEAFHHERADVVVGDAFAYLESSSGYDAVVYDLTMDPVREDQSRDAFIREIIDKVVDALEDDGMLSMQCCSEHQPELRDQVLEGLAERFEDVEDRTVVVPSYGERWVFASARGPKN